ncbi:MAG: ABC transporter substrate-binding protein [Dehalococcoidia bacterium]
MQNVISRPRWWLVMGALAAVLVIVFAACGDDDDDDGGATPEPTGDTTGIDISGVAELEDGVLKVGSDIAYPPIEYYEEGTQNATGLDIDLMKAMAAALGVEVEFEQVADFAGIVGDLNAKRYDIVMSAISINPEREAEIDMIPYFGPAGTGVLVQTGNPEGIAAIEDLCGKAVGAQVGTVQIDYMNDFNADQCAGNPIDIKEYPDNPASVEDLKLGRIAAQLSDDPVAAYSALQSDGDLEVTVTGFDSAPYGIGVRKDSTALRDVLEQALALIKEDGTYASILTDWGQEALAYEE